MRDRLDLASDLRPSGSYRARLVEVLVLSLSVPLLRLAFGCRDPFLWEAPCPWVAFAPVLLGALHGTLAASVSAGALGTLLLAHALHHGLPVSSLALRWGVPCYVIGAIAGRIADAQRERNERLRRQLQQLTAALSRERASREVLQVSHRRLLERLPPPTRCLQASLDAARALLRVRRAWSERGQVVLDVLAEHAAVQAATLFVADAGGAALAEPAVAQLGSTAVAARDLLVQRALRSGKLAMPAEPASQVAATAGVLAALPLVCEGRVLGVVAIQLLAFEAYEPRQLQEAMLLLAPLAAELAREQPLTAAVDVAAVDHAPAVLEAHWGGIA
ncbi:MAG TPA: hypothetical protein VJV78_02465 [Polyangiales bacterium]|nr:hypothetical protein [Polyangiales bacterium]